MINSISQTRPMSSDIPKKIKLDVDQRVTKAQLNKQLEELFTLSYNWPLIRKLNPHKIQQKAEQMKIELLNLSQQSQSRVYFERKPQRRVEKKKANEIFFDVFAISNKQFAEYQQLSSTRLNTPKKQQYSNSQICIDHGKGYNSSRQNSQRINTSQRCFQRSLRVKEQEEFSSILLIKSITAKKKSTSSNRSMSLNNQRILKISRNPFFKEKSTIFEDRTQLFVPKTQKYSLDRAKNYSAQISQFETNYITSHHMKLRSEIQEDYGPWNEQ